MVNHHPHLLGLPQGATISTRKRKHSNFFISYFSLIAGWCHAHHKLSHDSLEKRRCESNSVQDIDIDSQELGEQTKSRKSMNHSFRFSPDSMKEDNGGSPRGIYKHKSMDNYFSSVPPMSKSGSRRTAPSTPSFVNRSVSKRSPGGFSGPLPRSESRASTTPIMFSNSMGNIKPPAIIKNLECTLEEFCYGCKKKIKVTRDVITKTGEVIQEEELLTIKVKPGWKKGTKITFEGMGNERPGSSPADITFMIAEKRHPLFRRHGDDLEIGVEIPLVKALSGCKISIPSLGGEEQTLMIDDIVYPGYEKILEGQGMPNPKERGRRGNLKVVFLVGFPKELAEDQRSDIVRILSESR